jgi:hypothetical protein
MVLPIPPEGNAGALDGACAGCFRESTPWLRSDLKRRRTAKVRVALCVMGPSSHCVTRESHNVREEPFNRVCVTERIQEKLDWYSRGKRTAEEYEKIPGGRTSRVPTEFRQWVERGLKPSAAISRAVATRLAKYPEWDERDLLEDLLAY